jgi:hypothetical protein
LAITALAGNLARPVVALGLLISEIYEDLSPVRLLRPCLAPVLVPAPVLIPLGRRNFPARPIRLTLAVPLLQSAIPARPRTMNRQGPIMTPIACGRSAPARPGIVKRRVAVTTPVLFVGWNFAP